jgi:septin family protein
MFNVKISMLNSETGQHVIEGLLAKSDFVDREEAEAFRDEIQQKIGLSQITYFVMFSGDDEILVSENAINKNLFSFKIVDLKR